MSSPFPLLRLPRLVLCEVFKSFSIREKMNISFCSKKISTQINNARLYSQIVIVNLDMINRDITVHSENKKDTLDIFIYPDTGDSLSSTTQQFSVAYCSTGIKTFWKNYSEGFLSVIRHLLKMFRCKMTVTFNCHHSDLFQPTISMLFDLQVEFKELIIPLNRNLFEKISSNLLLVKYLSVLSTPDTAFIPAFTSWPQNIWIVNSAWFTLGTLLTCTCSRITLFQSHLENKDLDEVLRNWKAGGFPNLEFLHVGSHNITNNGDHILGMSPSELRGKDIQSNDGSRKAIIELGSVWIQISVTPL